MSFRKYLTLRNCLLTASFVTAMAFVDACSTSSSGDVSDVLVSDRAPDAAAAPLPTGWDSFISGMSSAGYSVVQGGLYILDADGCQLYLKIFKTCAGNNPVAPYLVIQPPVVAGEYIDPQYATAFGTTTSTGTPINEFYRMADNEAMIIIINLPPRAAYMGYLGYDYTRDIGNYPSSSTSSKLGTAPDPSRVITFGSFGNATNNVVIKNQSGLDWGGGVVAIISSSNQSLDTALRQVFRSSTNFSSNLLFSEPIGTNVTTGLSKPADELFALIRYALPEDSTAGSAWADTPGNNVWVFRVTDNSGAAVSRWATPSYTKKTATPEGSLADSQAELASLLATYVQSAQGVPATTVAMTPTVVYNQSGDLVGQVGQYCVQTGNNCAGDDQDTDAYRVANAGTLDGTRVAYVAGVDHTQFPLAIAANATYVSVGYYDGSNLTGIAGVSQTNQTAAGFSAGVLTGSAQQALQDLGLYSSASATLKADLQYLYVAAVGRTCPVPAASWCTVITSDQIPLSHSIVLSQRAYVRPGTTTGGNPNYMSSPTVVRPGSGS